MKISDLLENNEWANQEIDLPHLSKVQKARVLEWVRIRDQISEKYFIKFNMFLPIRDLNISPAKVLKFPRGFITFRDSINAALYDKAQKTFDRMIQAKLTYEKAGGIYLQ